MSKLETLWSCENDRILRGPRDFWYFGKRIYSNGTEFLLALLLRKSGCYIRLLLHSIFIRPLIDLCAGTLPNPDVFSAVKCASMLHLETQIRKHLLCPERRIQHRRSCKVSHAHTHHRLSTILDCTAMRQCSHLDETAEQSGMRRLIPPVEPWASSAVSSSTPGFIGANITA